MITRILGVAQMCDSGKVISLVTVVRDCFMILIYMIDPQYKQRKIIIAEITTITMPHVKYKLSWF